MKKGTKPNLYRLEIASMSAWENGVCVCVCECVCVCVCVCVCKIYGSLFKRGKRFVPLLLAMLALFYSSF